MALARPRHPSPPKKQFFAFQMGAAGGGGMPSKLHSQASSTPSVSPLVSHDQFAGLKEGGGVKKREGVKEGEGSYGGISVHLDGEVEEKKEEEDFGDIRIRVDLLGSDSGEEGAGEEGAGEEGEKVREEMRRSEEIETRREEIERGSEEIERGSEEIERGSEEIERGSEEIERGSEDFGRGSEEIERGSEEIERGSEEIERGSEEIERGSEERERGSEDIGRGSEEIERGSEEMGSGGWERGSGNKERGGNGNFEMGRRKKGKRKGKWKDGERAKEQKVDWYEIDRALVSVVEELKGRFGERKNRLKVGNHLRFSSFSYFAKSFYGEVC